MLDSKRKHSSNDQENMDLTATKTRRTTTKQAHQVSNDTATPGQFLKTDIKLE
jgi:hypothetical protein